MHDELRSEAQVVDPAARAPIRACRVTVRVRGRVRGRVEVRVRVRRTAGLG